MKTTQPAFVAPAPVAARSRFQARDTFAALKHPNFRLWFYGQLVSLTGTWMQNTAQGYLVYELTHSPAYLGYVGFAAGLPSWLFTLYGGVVADRVPRRTLLAVTQTVMMLLAFVLAALVFTGLVQPWHIIVLAFLLGIANAFDAPARQAFVVELVEREDLTNAIALNAIMFNSATVVGPSVAGITYALVGPAWCFTINAVTFLAVIAALLRMRIKAAHVAQQQRRSTMRQLGEGLRFVARNRQVQVIILNIGVASLFGLSLMTLLPAWSVDVLHGDVTTNGLLISARGVGALAGALVVATLSKYRIKGRLWTTGTFLLPLMLLLFSQVRWLPLSIATLVAIGWAWMIMANTSNALVQVQLPDELRGRVMSIYTLVFFGSMPVGALLAGGLASIIDEPLVVVLGACVLLLSAIVLWVRVPSMRRLE